MLCKIYLHTYINGRMRPVETILGMGIREIKENNGVGKFKDDMFDIL
jgi:hypothetical protein